MTATPAAPASIRRGAFAAVMPPMPMTGTPTGGGASRSNAAKPLGPSAGPASGLLGVAKQGPTLQ